MATDVFVDYSATYNGDGTSAAPAAGDGLPGAYNDLASALSAAPQGGGWDIWVRRLDSDISVSATLSPTNDGDANNPHRIIGWPIHVERTGFVVDSVPSGTDTIGFANATWQFIDAALTEPDNYWIAAVVTFTSGANSGSKRKVIWFDAASHQVYLDFPLPNEIAAGDTYDIVLETEEYANRPQSGIDAGWDSDSNPRPVFNGGDTSYGHMMSFSYDYYWDLLNLELCHSGSKDLIQSQSGFIRNCVFHDCSRVLYASTTTVRNQFTDLYSWNVRSGDGFHYGISYHELTDCHFQGEVGQNRNGFKVCTATLRNCTFGRVIPFGIDINHAYNSIHMLRGENVILASPTKAAGGSLGIGTGRPMVTISGYNGESDKFHQWRFSGEVFNVDADGTISPPSGASTYIKLLPNSRANQTFNLRFDEQRYQAEGSKTYTWKFYPTGWTSLTTDDLEVWAWYLDEATGAHRAEVTANPTLVANDTWNDLVITVNPAQAGTVYFELRLKKYEAGAFVAIDPKVDVV